VSQYRLPLTGDEAGLQQVAAAISDTLAAIYTREGVRGDVMTVLLPSAGPYVERFRRLCRLRGERPPGPGEVIVTPLVNGVATRLATILARSEGGDPPDLTPVPGYCRYLIIGFGTYLTGSIWLSPVVRN
jgi:hypothetical protein